MCSHQQPLPLRAAQDILHAAVTHRLQPDAKNGWEAGIPTHTHRHRHTQTHTHTHRHRHTHTHTNRNSGCITIIMSNSCSVARSGYRKMPCRQTHYKYERERGRATERERRKEGEDKRKKERKREKSSEDGMKKERDHRRRESNFKQQSGGLSASISRSVAEADARRPPRLQLSQIKLGPTLTWMLHVEVTSNQTLSVRQRATTGQTRVWWAWRSSLSKHRHQLLMILKNFIIKHNHSQASKQTAQLNRNHGNICGC